MIQIFDQVNGRPVASIHCKMVKQFRTIIEEFPDDYLQIFYYIQAVYCHDPTVNVYVHQPEDMREEIVIADIGPLRFSVEDEYVQEAIEKYKQLYSTPVDIHYLGIKTMMEKMSRMLMTEEITTTGKDANLTALRGAVKDAPSLWKSYKEMAVELIQEQSVARGNIRRAYDQLPGYKNLKEDE